MLLQHALLLAALAILSPTRCGSLRLDLSETRSNHNYNSRFRYRVIVLTQYSTIWPKVLMGRSSVRQTYSVAENQALMNRFQTRNLFFTVAALLLSLASDANYSYANLWTVLPGYTALAFHAAASIAAEQAQSVFPSSVTPQMVTAASALGSCFLAIPLYAFRTFMVGAWFWINSTCGANTVPFSLRVSKPPHRLYHPSSSFPCWPPR